MIKRVVLESGGLDSFLCWYIFRQDALNVFVDIGHKYSRKEGRALGNLKEQVPNFNVVEHKGSQIGPLEDEKSGIIPNRNAELILSAAVYGERIYFGVIKDEINSDKSLEFIKAMEDVLDISNRKQYWTEEKTFKVMSPYKNTTKTQLIKDYLADGGNPDILLESYSCYEGKEELCGWCKPCFRKWVSLHNNEIAIPENYYKNDPWDAPWLPELKPIILEGRYRGMEDIDWCSALSDKGKL